MIIASNRGRHLHRDLRGNCDPSHISPSAFSVVISQLSLANCHFQAFEMDKDFCSRQAKLVRSLADDADPLVKRRLLQLAEHYERRLSILAARKEEVQEPERE
jgi:hypothetical protein